MTTFYPRTFYPWMQNMLPAGFTPSKMLQDGVVDDPSVELMDRQLWETFSKVGTEMVITKPGRRIFPTIRVKISGLNETSRYYILMDLVSPDPVRYKFSNGEWIAAGTADPPLPPRPFFHPDGPSTGEVWMGRGANFSKMKLTNNMSDSNGQMVLHSMHKYLPRLHIIRCDSIGHPIFSTTKTFCFNETAFIAVTAYQNAQVTQLKIEKNPFAKGFRKDGNGRREMRRPRMRRCVESDEENVEKEETKVHPDLMTQWHMALLSTFGGPFFRQIESSKRKGGFDVIDILSKP